MPEFARDSRVLIESTSASLFEGAVSLVTATSGKSSAR